MTVKYSYVKKKPAKIKGKPDNLKTKIAQSTSLDCKTNKHFRSKKFHTETNYAHL